jgi:TRAP-type mannitol/chloroaromatic compound transport system permease small subunit
MLAGAYAYRDETHVRVDIVYSKLSLRGRAICDVITSVFFFLFAGTMLVTGWRFASDSMSVGESSFTEWGIQYWPVKLAIPIGATLLLLQGFSRLVRDIAVVARKAG